MLVLYAPDSFRKEIEEMQTYTQVHETMEKLQAIRFVMAFVIKEEQIQQLTPPLNQLLQGDGTYGSAILRAPQNAISASSAEIKVGRF